MQPPSQYTTSGALMLASGVLNVLISAGILIGLLLSIVGLCVAPIWVATLAVGIVEIVVGGIALGGRPVPRILGASVGGLVAAVCCGNLIGMVLEIVALAMLGQPDVRGYLQTEGARPALPPPGQGERSSYGDGVDPAAQRGPADFRPPPRRHVGTAWSWTGDLPLAQKEET